MAIRTITKVMTPKEAMHILKTKNTNNRAIMPMVVAKYARDMREGKWALTHQGITFLDDDSLGDGQHTLTAIVMAGIPVKIRVTYGVPVEAMKYIDTGKNRRDHDALKIAGIGDYSLLDLATVRCIQEMPSSVRRVWSRSDMIEAIEKSAELMAFAKELQQNARLLSRAAVYALFARATLHHHTDTVKEFAEVYFTGYSTSAKHKPVILYRNWVMNDKPQRRGIVPNCELYRKGQAAMEAFVHGRTLTKLYETADDLYPLPQEMIVKSADTRKEYDSAKKVIDALKSA